MARILILSLVFPPDGVSTAQLMGEIAVDLRGAGHDVSIVTTTPHYNRDETAEAGQPLSWGRFRILKRSTFHGMPVLHVPVPRKSGRILPRLLSWGWFHLASTLAASFMLGRPDVILAPSPPLTIGVSAWIVAVLRRSRFVYNVQEIYPDVAVNLGALKNPRLIRPLLQLERFVYDRASVVTVIGQGMRSRLVEKGVSPEKVRVIPNFVDLGDLRSVPKDNEFARRWGLHDRFVVSYAGNMGPAQGLEVLIQAAVLLREERGIRFLLMGNGSVRGEIEASVERLGLDNVLLLNHQPYEMVPQIYGASDLCVVPLVQSTGADAAPSKVYRIMACGRPVLALTAAASDLAAVVTTSGSGWVVDSDDAADVAASIREVYLNPDRARACGSAGRSFVEQYHARERITRMYEDVLVPAGEPVLAGLADAGPVR
jgi:colanic acid biosynthesis glycosyl transferase WcaI